MSRFRLRATNTYLDRGARLLVGADEQPLEAPAEVAIVFSDGVPLEAALVEDAAGFVLHAPPHRTFAGSTIPAKSWRVSRIEKLDETTSALVIGPRVATDAGG